MSMSATLLSGDLWDVPPGSTRFLNAPILCDNVKVKSRALDTMSMPSSDGKLSNGYKIKISERGSDTRHHS